MVSREVKQVEVGHADGRAQLATSSGCDYRGSMESLYELMRNN
jgi:hypothetical protein